MGDTDGLIFIHNSRGWIVCMCVCLCVCDTVAAAGEMTYILLCGYGVSQYRVFRGHGEGGAHTPITRHHLYTGEARGAVR
jgi:hypothetical protein